MTDELENALAEEFPFMRWVPEDGGRWIGIFCECEDGWYPLIREMCREIATSFEKTGAPADIVVEQVKQKYGELRFYFRSNNPLIQTIVDKYEDRSGEVCEVCGQPGCLRPDLFWTQTLCGEHYAQKKPDETRRRRINPCPAS